MKPVRFLLTCFVGLPKNVFVAKNTENMENMEKLQNENVSCHVMDMEMKFVGVNGEIVFIRVSDRAYVNVIHCQNES